MLAFTCLSNLHFLVGVKGTYISVSENEVPFLCVWCFIACILASVCQPACDNYINLVRCISIFDVCMCVCVFAFVHAVCVCLLYPIK